MFDEFRLELLCLLNSWSKTRLRLFFMNVMPAHFFIQLEAVSGIGSNEFLIFVKNFHNNSTCSEHDNEVVCILSVVSLSSWLPFCGIWRHLFFEFYCDIPFIFFKYLVLWYLLRCMGKIESPLASAPFSKKLASLSVSGHFCSRLFFILFRSRKKFISYSQPSDVIHFSEICQ